MTAALERTIAAPPSPNRSAAARVLALTIAVAWTTSSAAAEKFRIASEAPPGDEGVGSGQDDGRCAPVRLEISRRAVSASCTLGTLTVNGVEVGYTLEKGYAGNVSNVSSIPGDRTYRGSMRADGHLGWRVELGGVPGRSSVQIHIGNYPTQSKGCILLGSAIDRHTCAVWGSGRAMETLRAVMGEDPASGGAPCQERKVAVAVRGRALGEQQVGCYDRTRCIQQEKVKTGTECGSSDSMKVVWKNGCDDDVKAVVCFARPNGTLECGSSRIRAKGQQTDWSCHATAVHVAAFHVDDPYQCFETEKKRWAERPGP